MPKSRGRRIFLRNRVLPLPWAAGGFARGLRPLGSKSSDLAPAPQTGGRRPPQPPWWRALRPSTPAYYFTMRGALPLCTPQSRRSALHPGDFPVAGKVTKGAPRAAALWNPASEDNPPLLVLRCACTRAAFSHNKRPICHFKFVGKSVFFLPKLHRGSHPLLSIRGAVGEVPSRMLEGLSYREQYR